MMDLKVGTWNLNGFVARLPRLKYLLEIEKPDVLVLVEHQLKKNNHEDQKKRLIKGLPPEYEVAATNKSESGKLEDVWIITKRPLRCRPMSVQEQCRKMPWPKGLELVSVIVEGVLIVGVYRRPNNRVGRGTVDECFDYLWSVLSDVAVKEKHIVSLGDFNTGKPENIDCFNRGSLQKGLRCRMLFNKYITTHKLGGTLDNIIVDRNRVEVVKLVRYWSLLESDHYPLFAYLRFPNGTNGFWFTPEPEHREASRSNAMNGHSNSLTGTGHHPLFADSKYILKLQESKERPIRPWPIGTDRHPVFADLEQPWLQRIPLRCLPSRGAARKYLNKWATLMGTPK